MPKVNAAESVKLVEIKGSKMRAIIVHGTVINVGNNENVGIDIRKYYYDAKSGEYQPTPKGIFLTQEELKSILGYLGFEYDNVNPQVKNFLDGSEDKVPILK